MTPTKKTAAKKTAAKKPVTKKTAASKSVRARKPRKPKEPLFLGKFGGSPAAEVHLNDAERELFLAKLFEASPLLGSVRHIEMKRSRVEVAPMSLGDRTMIARQTPFAVSPEKKEVDDIVLTSCHVAIPLGITEESIEDNPDDWRPAALASLCYFGGRDLEDLALNGDERSRDSLLWSNDGWLLLAARRQRITLRRSIVNRRDVLRGLAGVAPRHREDGKLAVIISPMAHAWLGSPETIHGIAVRVSSFIADSALLVTHKDNLVLGMLRDIKLRQTTEGVEAITRDRRYAVAHVRVDFELQNPEASCSFRVLTVGDVLRAATADVRLRLAKFRVQFRAHQLKARFLNTQTAVALIAGILGGAAFAAARSYFS